MMRNGFLELDRSEGVTFWGLMKETARVIRKHARLLLPFILAFALPVSFFSALAFVSNALSVHRFLHGNSMQVATFNTTQQGTTTIVDPSTLPSTIVIVGVLAFALAKVVIKNVLALLQVASISYCVDFIYKGDAESFSKTKPIQEIFKRLPGALYRMFITCLELACILIPIFVVVLVLISIFFLFFQASHPEYTILLSSILIGGLSLLLSFLFMFSNTLSTLEIGCYGWPALKRSLVLITQMKLRAVAIFLFRMLISLTLLALACFVPLLPQVNHDWTLNPLGYTCLALLSLVGDVYLIVLVTIFYFSLKHRENATINGLPKLNPPKYTPLDVNETMKV